MLVSQTGSAADYSAPADWGRGGIASWSGNSRPYVALKREERLAAVDSAFSHISLVPGRGRTFRLTIRVDQWNCSVCCENDAGAGDMKSVPP